MYQCVHCTHLKDSQEWSFYSFTFKMTPPCYERTQKSLTPNCPQTWCFSTRPQEQTCYNATGNKAFEGVLMLRLDYKTGQKARSWEFILHRLVQEQNLSPFMLALALTLFTPLLPSLLRTPYQSWRVSILPHWTDRKPLFSCRTG